MIDTTDKRVNKASSELTLEKTNDKRKIIIDEIAKYNLLLAAMKPSGLFEDPVKFSESACKWSI